MLPNDLPLREAVYQQSQRWLEAGCFEAMVSDLRSIIRVRRRQGQPSARAGGWPHAAIELRERATCRLWRLQTQARQQSAWPWTRVGGL